jgi:hypothetical protein
MKFEAYIPYNITQAREAKRFNEKEIAGTKVEFDFQDIVGKYDRFEQNGKEIFFPPNFTAREIIIPWLIKGNIPKIKSEWISVKNRLPEISRQVLTYEKDAVMPIKVNYIRNYEGQFSYGKTENISHWMPLPNEPND